MWQQLLKLFEKADRPIKICEGDYTRGVNEINEIGASPESVLGAVIVNSCGIVFDNWVFVIGQSSGNYGILNFSEKMNYDSNGLLVVATDIVGGVFALNMGRFAEDQGMVWYFAPDTLKWESLEMKYSGFIAWLTQGDLSGYYSSMKWTDWRKDAESVSFGEGILIYPYLWAKECNIETASKTVVPLSEILRMNDDFSKRIGC